ncbi:hypothetical protein Scep_020549 [Stephania cephalantha]|uniref:Kinesin motor domain-containing protein n=1 Tax=Stephania cephalantha TaxID=152367 RepID=A0AAP0ICZ9_9MAGN
MAPSHCRSNGLMYQASNASVEMDLADETTGESFDAPKLGDSISVCVRFRPLSEREFLRGDEIAWYADGDKVVRSEYNPATAYAFGTFASILDLNVVVVVEGKCFVSIVIVYSDLLQLQILCMIQLPDQ